MENELSRSGLQLASHRFATYATSLSNTEAHWSYFLSYCNDSDEVESVGWSESGGWSESQPRRDTLYQYDDKNVVTVCLLL